MNAAHIPTPEACTIAPPPALLLTHGGSRSLWTTKRWEVGIWQRQEAGCSRAGSASFDGKLTKALEGRLDCRETGIHWALKTEGGWLVWKQGDAIVGRMQIEFPRVLGRRRITVEGPSGTYHFRDCLTLMTELREENVCFPVETKSGWFEICPFPAELPKVKRKVSGLLDRLTLWVLKPGEEKTQELADERPLSMEGLVELVAENSANGRAIGPPGNASAFFTGRGTTASPDDPVDQWLLVGAAAVHYGVFYP